MFLLGWGAGAAPRVSAGGEAGDTALPSGWRNQKARPGPAGRWARGPSGQLLGRGLLGAGVD